jgi:hypothetical protein
MLANQSGLGRQMQESWWISPSPPMGMDELMVGPAVAMYPYDIKTPTQEVLKT